ncbi:hypothetical protein TNCV_4914121 [Trichonephila clavipes]|nr:hypothetical protein TNCV_4914121 [Trichonephila clavipes]
MKSRFRIDKAIDLNFDKPIYYAMLDRLWRLRGSGISRQMRDGIGKGEVVNPDDPDKNNEPKLLNYCIAVVVMDK